MKGFLNRFFALVCCFSLTLGCFVYSSPKAQAVFTEPAVALGCGLLTSVIVGTTANLVFTDAVKEDIGYAIDGLVTKYLDTVGDAAAITADNFFSIIASGPKLLTTGAILLSKEAGELIGRFIAWLQEDSGYISADGSATNIYSNSTIYIDGSAFSPVYYQTWRTSSRFFEYGVLYECSDRVGHTGTFQLLYNSSSSRMEFLENGNVRNYFSSVTPDDVDGYALCSVSADTLDDISYIVGFYYKSDGSKAICANGAFQGAGVQFTPTEAYSVCVPNTTLQIIPQEIPDGQAMVISGVDGIVLDDQSAAADAIFDAVLAGTLSPTVTVEDVATDIPDTGTETDTSILSWTKKIWQAVTDIPAAIGEKLAAIPAAVADAIAAVFAPDAALINEITTTFNNKFGFLDTLHTVGNDLLNMDADTAPPVVYIHLENAEGGVVWGGTEKALDMTWYQRYKADVDTILSGFLWVAFLWLLFKRAPDILAGAGLIERESSDIYMADSPDNLGGFLSRRKRY